VSPVPPSATRSLAAAFGLAAIWLLTHRYGGIQHDGLFYAVQAVARADPSAFRNDLFFAFGSQDDFTVFSRPHAWLAGWLGLERAALLLLAGAHLLWALAAYAIARQWLGGRALWICLALLFALPRHYGAMDVFHFAEGFLTARSWAEPLVLASVAAGLAGRKSLSVALIVAAAALHPIMAAAGALFLLIFLGGPRVAAAVALAGTAAWLALPAPRVMDPEWLAIVLGRAPFLTFERWTWGELGEPLVWIGILLVAAKIGPLRIRGACRALAAVGLVGLLLGAAATLTHATLLLQTQPWRVLWLTKVLGLVALTVLFAERWRGSRTDRWLLIGLVAAVFTAETAGGPAAIAIALIVGRLGEEGLRSIHLPDWFPVAGTIAIGVVALQSALVILQQFQHVADKAVAIQQLGMPVGDFASFFGGPLAVLLPLAMWWLLRLANRHERIAAGVAAAVLAIAALGWRLDDDPTHRQMFGPAPPRPFGEAIPRNATVYWSGNFLYAWFLLRQGNYASPQQAVGVVFSRQTAIEARRRLDRLAAIGAPEALLAATLSGPRPAGSLGNEGLAWLCADPLLDFVILRQRIVDGAPEWQDPATGIRWHLHRCRAPLVHPAA
jgi:hypothetical protein